MAASDHTEFYPSLIGLLAECEAVVSAPEFSEDRWTDARDRLALIDPAISDTDQSGDLPSEYGISTIPVRIRGEERREIIAVAVAMHGRLADAWNAWMDAQEETQAALWAAAEKAFPAGTAH